MAKTYSQLQAEIEKLQESAKAIRAKEAADVIQKIKSAIQAYELTPEDLFGTSKPGRTASKAASSGKRAPSKLIGTKLPIKYRDETGNTWTGRGMQPRWLKTALESGRKLEDFSIG